MLSKSLGVWRPRTTAILIGGVVLIIVASAVAFMVSAFQPRVQVRVGSGVFQAKLADTESARLIGLSDTTELKPSDALLMVFDTDDTWGIWMKNMKVSIDIVWLDQGKKVVHIVKNAAPELSTDKTFYPKEKARYVLELPAGAVETNGIKIGQTATFNLPKEKSQ